MGPNVHNLFILTLRLGQLLCIFILFASLWEARARKGLIRPPPPNPPSAPLPPGPRRACATGA